jgi:CRISPR-associated protein Csx10
VLTLFFPYTLTLGAPLLATRLDADTSSAATSRFIPGSVIRGALAGKMDPQDPLFHTLILSGKVCCLNCYPQTSAGYRSLPVPVSLRAPKYGLLNRYYDLSNYRSKEEWPEEELEKTPAEFMTLDQPDHRWVKVETTLKIHHQRDRKLGHATKQTGLFAYESMDPGQTFGGYLVVQEDDRETIMELFDKVAALLGDTLLLGRSRRAEYGGLASLSWKKTDVRERELATYGLLLDKDVEPGERFKALLTSDYVGRFIHSGLVNPGAFGKELAQALGADSAEVVNQFFDFRRIGGFNRKWQLPLPQASALAAGSIIVFEAKKKISLSALKALEGHAFGERVAEGYGRISFLSTGDQEMSIEMDKRMVQTLPDMTSESPPITLRQVERRLLYQALTDQVYRIAHNIEVSDPPSRSLIGRFRVVLRMPCDKALSQMEVWLKDNDEPGALRPHARNQLKRCRLEWLGETVTMYDWLCERISESKAPALDKIHGLRSDLKLDVISRECMITTESSVKETMVGILPEIIRLLIGALFTQIARQSQKAERGE